MGLFDKIKNALFEEEYVEVEEKPKKEKIKKEPLFKHEEKPIAKKVILPEKHKEEKEKIVEHDEVELKDEDFETPPIVADNIKEEEPDFKFPMMDDKDFRMEDNHYKDSEPKIVKIIQEDEEYTLETKEEVKEEKREEKPKLYGIDSTDRMMDEQRTPYESKKEEKKVFRPSPIISPIYGVLDKNYKKEDVVSKKEVRLTSSYARENLNLDDVRRKAYGTLADDIASGEAEVTEEEKPTFEVKENTVVDLTNNEEKPKVNKVTMGDAEEYFQDLGLEYNVDYKDSSHDNTDSTKKERKREKKDEEYSEQEAQEQKTQVVPEKEANETKDLDNTNDNLFDLIDSMYKEEN